MERKNLINNLKDHNTSSRANNNSNLMNPDRNNNKRNSSSTNKLIKYPWSSNSNTSKGEDYLSRFSWPPRSYTCSFCKRELRSAQALGGHMNVHRRDRATLRLLMDSSSSSVVSLLCSTKYFSASSSSKATSFDITRNSKTRKSFFDINEEFKDGRKLLKKAEILRLDLEIGLSHDHSKEDLDLELRLGYT